MDADKKKFLKSWMRTTIEVLQLSKDDIVSIVDEVFADVANPKSTGAEIDSDVQVGWYAFEGAKFSPNPRTYPNLQGVVAWVNPDKNAPKGKRGLIVTPEQVQKIWAKQDGMIGIVNLNDGFVNTQQLMAYAKDNNVKFPAAEWCANYSQNGVKPGEGFLPAIYQVRLMVSNHKIVNRSLVVIGGDKLVGWIWSSSEYGKGKAWNEHVYGGAYSSLTCRVFNVRCCLAF